LPEGKSKRTSALVNKGVPEKDALPKYCPEKPPLVNPPPFARVLLLTAKSPTYVVGLGEEEGVGADEGQGVDAGEDERPSVLRSVAGAINDTDGGVLSADMLGATDGETVARAPFSATIVWLGSGPTLSGATDTLTSMVELPRVPRTAPTTVKENVSCP
jgi:hypothetical protein